MQLPEKLEFLSAISFWVMVFNAVVYYATQKGWIGDAELKLVTAIAVPFIAIDQGRKAARDLGKTENEAAKEIKEEKVKEKEVD